MELTVVVKLDTTAELKPVGVLGVDLGIVDLAVDSDGNTHAGRQVAAECG